MYGCHLIIASNKLEGYTCLKADLWREINWNMNSEAGFWRENKCTRELKPQGSKTLWRETSASREGYSTFYGGKKNASREGHPTL